MFGLHPDLLLTNVANNLRVKNKNEKHVKTINEFFHLTFFPRRVFFFNSEIEDFPFCRKPKELDISVTSCPNSKTMRKRRKGAFEGTFFTCSPRICSHKLYVHLFPSISLGARYHPICNKNAKPKNILCLYILSR